MAGNTFGKLFCVTSFGESHGEAIGGVIDGMPAGFDVPWDILKRDIQRRKTGQSKWTSQRQEEDEVRFLSGIYEGKTTGTSIGFIIENKDAKPKDYEAIKELFRPGHGAYTYFKKYGIRDHRGGGRASARETLIRVIGGAFAKAFLQQKEIDLYGYVSQIGNLKCDPAHFEQSFIEENALFCPDAHLLSAWENLIQAARKEGESLGARVEVVANHVPAGLGEPVYEGLDARLASAMMSINAAKGVSIGDGFECVTSKGSEFRDEMTKEGFLSNHAGGTLAGISTGQPLRVSVAFKPASSILIPGRTLTHQGEETTVLTKGRHDPCVGIRAVPVVEAMMALVLADAMLLSSH